LKSSTTVHVPTPLLVIGYGNTLRQDDSAGPRVAEKVGALKLRGVRTLVVPQLSPEHAEALAGARSVVFVDAAVGADKGVRLRRLVPGDSSHVTTHAAEPRTLLALAREVYGRAPQGWMLTIPAVQLGFGEEVSPVADRGIDAATRKVAKLASIRRL
jgi:hydrogenase maturation protease